MHNSQNAIDTSFTIIPSNDGVCIIKFDGGDEIHVSKGEPFILATAPTLLDKIPQIPYARQTILSALRKTVPSGGN